jgi:hypothetical protein
MRHLLNFAALFSKKLRTVTMTNDETEATPLGASVDAPLDDSWISCHSTSNQTSDLLDESYGLIQ